MDSSEVRRALFGSEALPRLPPRVHKAGQGVGLAAPGAPPLGPAGGGGGAVAPARHHGSRVFRDRTNALDAFAAYAGGPGLAREC